ncbi:MAG: VOC family protein [Ignavibacteria bacterium]|nr:VOC family protein [Ignavibacteria bacterium]
MQKIIPSLWFEKEAKEASEFLVSIFGENSRVINTQLLRNTPSGDADLVTFELRGYRFMAISGGPYFKINPSISFILTFNLAKDRNSYDNLNYFWEKLTQDGKILMPLDKYFFSERFGWVEDKFGISWQLTLIDDEKNERDFITPALMFANERFGFALEATDYYISLFNNSRRVSISRYPMEMGPNNEATMIYSEFILHNQWFAVLDNPYPQNFGFNEAIAFVVACDSQEEVDYFWSKLTFYPEAEQCGWLKDKYGISWQIIPKEYLLMMQTASQQQIDRVLQAVLNMKKLDLTKLKEVFNSIS